MPRAGNPKRPIAATDEGIPYPFSVISPSCSQNMVSISLPKGSDRVAHFEFPVKLLQRMLQLWIVFSHYPPRP